MSVVVDSSVILALLFGEIDGEAILTTLHEGHLCAANLIEILTRANDRGVPTEDADRIVERLRLQVHALDHARAVSAAKLRPVTRHLGLSLGDRSCLALAQSLGLEAVTADRAWATLDVDIPVHLIR